MTNEEAREQLKDIARSFSREYFHDWREALDVAIKALEQQPCEDAASKQIRDCENCIHYKDGGCEVWECKFEAKEEESEDSDEETETR